MARKVFKVALFTIAFGCTLFLIYGIVEKAAAKKQIQSKVRMLPETKFFAMDSSIYSFPSSALAIVFFNSGCEHCRYELEQISKKLQLFSNKELILLSSENIATIKKTSEGLGLSNLPNIHFTKINPTDVFDTFGSLSVPHVFIYGNDQKLIKEFKGETKIEAIAEYLP